MRERKQGRTVSAYLNYEEAQAFEARVDKEQASENQIIKKALREYLEREGEHE